MGLHQLVAADAPIAMRALMAHSHSALPKTKLPSHNLSALDAGAFLSAHC
jgi:hypothetical protein